MDYEDEEGFLPPVDAGKKSANVLCANDGGKGAVVRK